MLVSRIMRLTRDDVIEDGRVPSLAVDGHRLILPTRLAHLVRRYVTKTSRDGLSAAWEPPRRGSCPPRAPRPAVDILFGVRLRRHGIDAHAGRNTGCLVLAAELPASVLADLTGISISTAERWSQWGKRDWAAYVRAARRRPHGDPVPYEHFSSGFRC